MIFLKRATISIFRQPVKTVVLLLLIFILGVVMSGAISATTAITNTEANLRRQMRPIVAFEQDHDAVHAVWEEAGGYWHMEEFEVEGGISVMTNEPRGADFPTVLPITSELIRQIATLPQVEYYHYSVTSWFGTQLLEYLPEGAESTTEGRSTCIFNEETHGCVPNTNIYNINDIALRGTSAYEPIEMREGLIELVSGSDFENQHLTSAYPALVSSGFAEVNGFQIGSTFTLESRIFRRDIDWNEEEINWENFFFDQMEHEFEIIGLFDVMPLETDDEWFEAQRQRELANRIFTSNEATSAIELFEFEANIAAAEAAGEETWFDPDNWHFTMEKSIMLTDPLEVVSFKEDVASYLPEFWIVNDLTTFDQISASIETLNEIAGGILIATVGATVLILGLLILLFLNDRRHEIGIYLALGEKRLKIILQILFEVLTTALIGITFSIFVGNIISANLSSEMIRTELARPVEHDQFRGYWFYGLSELGFNRDLSPEEMLEAFDTSLTGNAIVLLYVVGLGTVAVSTLVPIIYVVKLKPKKVLL